MAMCAKPLEAGQSGAGILEEVTGVILSGGKSSRFGSDKARASLFGRGLIEHVLDALREVFPSVFVITNRPEEYRYLGVPLFPDILPSKGPLTGLHSALCHARTHRVFLVACDMPLVSPAIVRAVASIPVGSRTGALAVVPRFGGRLQPLHALYHRDLMPFVEESLAKGELKMSSVLAQAKCRIVEEEEIRPLLPRRYEPLGISPFVNVNRREELERLEHLLGPV